MSLWGLTRSFQQSLSGRNDTYPFASEASGVHRGGTFNQGLLATRVIVSSLQPQEA